MRSINLRNGQSFGEFIKSAKYSIPWYQREYSWSIDELNDFIDDLHSSKNENREHFFGVIMTMPKYSDNESRIIDGQQRITTAMLFFKAIKDIIIDNQLDNHTSLSDHALNIDKFIYNYQEFASADTLLPRLKPAELNQETFDLIFSNKSIENKKRSFDRNKKIKQTNKKLFNAYLFFLDIVMKKISVQSASNDGIDFRDSTNISNYFQELLLHLTSHFIILHISVDSQLFAYNFFQTVNDRGTKLTISDILKAYFFELSENDEEKRKVIANKWKSFMNQIENVDVNIFLRHYWLSAKGTVSEKYLLDNIQKDFNSYEKVLEFLDNIIENASFYQILVNEEFANDDEKDLLKNVFVLAKKQVLPTLLPAMMYMGRNDFKQYIKMLTTFIFRYRTIAHKENKLMEKLFSDISIKIRNERGNNVLEFIKDKLTNEDIDDEVFIITFLNFQTKTNRIAKYILEELEKYLRENNFREWDNKMSVEHILPKSYEQNWSEFCLENDFNPEDYLYRLGNLTLVTRPLNSTMKNAFFSVKKEVILENSNYEINNSLDVEKWDDKAIVKRQKKFSEIISQIWSLDNF